MGELAVLCPAPARFCSAVGLPSPAGAHLQCCPVTILQIIGLVHTHTHTNITLAQPALRPLTLLPLPTEYLGYELSQLCDGNSVNMCVCLPAHLRRFSTVVSQCSKTRVGLTRRLCQACLEASAAMLSLAYPWPEQQRKDLPGADSVACEPDRCSWASFLIILLICLNMGITATFRLLYGTNRNT